MSDIGRERFEKLKAYADGLTEVQFKAHTSKGQTNDQAVFDLIKNGDALGLYCSIKHDPSLLERQDKNGMTPLHWSSVDKSGLIHEILASEASAAPWTHDKFGRLPLDVARETSNQQVGDNLERLTYPQLFKEEKDGPVRPDILASFNSKRKELGNPNTSPNFSKKFTPKSITPQLRNKGSGMEIER